jgi:hypothetical protein
VKMWGGIAIDVMRKRCASPRESNLQQGDVRFSKGLRYVA